MIRSIVAVCSVLVMLAISSCDDDPVTHSPSPNGFIVRGDGGSSADVETTTSPTAAMDANMSSVVMGGVRDGDIASVIVVFNGNTPGVYNWADSMSYVVLRLGYGSNARDYTSRSGRTILTSGGTSGSTAIGTFEGTLVDDANAANRVEISGRFNVAVR